MGRRPAGLQVPYPGPAYRRGRALPDRYQGPADAPGVQVPPGHHRHSGYGRAVGTGQAYCRRARKLQRFLSQPFTVAQVFTGIEGKLVDLKDTIRSFKSIINASATTCLRVLSTWLATSRAHA